jgi:4-carboxymuconolactone decarboxylase
MSRLEPITRKEQVPAEHQAVFDAVVKSRGGVHGPFTMLMHCPPLAEHFVNIGGYIRFEGKLDHRVRVLAAMTVAREFDAVYIWGAQTGQARKRDVPESTITAIREKHSRGLPAEDAQIVDFTRELIRKHRVDNATMNALLERFGKEQLVELTGTIGYYSMLAMTANAVELDPAAGAEVLQMEAAK